MARISCGRAAASGPPGWRGMGTTPSGTVPSGMPGEVTVTGTSRLILPHRISRRKAICRAAPGPAGPPDKAHITTLVSPS